jgi:transposase
MGVKEAVRLAVIREAHEGRLTIREGMRRTGLSRSQFLRYKARYRRSGPAGLVHAGRGRASPRRTAAEVRQRVMELLAGEVPLNDCHVRDLVAAEGLQLSADTVRRLRQERGWPPKQRRRPRRYRQRRERKAQEGAMVLVDGSPFRWLGTQQPRSTLMGAMDDASGRVLALTFRENEDLHGYAVVLRDTLDRYGVPWTLYGDRATVLVRSDRYWSLEEELAGRQSPSHFGGMLEALGVRYIAALSPQAKGRIERLWRTLQDRLAAELALHRCHTPAQAEAFLPAFIERHNQRFAQPARDLQPAWRKPPRDVDRLLGCGYPRIVRADNTVTLAGEVLQLPPGPGGRSYTHCRVEVRELLDGRCLVLHEGRLLLERPAPPGTFHLVPRAQPGEQQRRRARPAVPAAPKPQPTARPVPARRGSPLYLARIKPKANHPFRKPYETIPRNRKEEPKRVSPSLRR